MRTSNMVHFKVCFQVLGRTTTHVMRAFVAPEAAVVHLIKYMSVGASDNTFGNDANGEWLAANGYISCY